MSAVAGLTALLLAAVVAIEVVRLAAGARRRVRLNRALHELRRPVQGLSLAIESNRRDPAAAASWVAQMRDALAEIDAEVNGRTRQPVASDVALGEVATALERRWRALGLRVEAPAHGPIMRGDASRLGAALDNLVANAFGHGGGAVSVRATAPGVARLEVRDDGSSEAGATRASRDPRRGHGLAVAAEVAAAHEGVLLPPRRVAGGGTVVALSLPVAEGTAGGDAGSGAR